MKGILFVLLLFSGFSYSQEEVYAVVENEPVFPGGEEAMAVWIASQINYPKKSIKKGETGTVYVQFVVLKDGSVDGVKVVRGVTKRLDEEALRVIKLMPKWTPAELNGEKVNCRYTIPIKFVLPD